MEQYQDTFTIKSIIVQELVDKEKQKTRHLGSILYFFLGIVPAVRAAAICSYFEEGLEIISLILCMTPAIFNMIFLYFNSYSQTEQNLRSKRITEEEIIKSLESVERV